MIDASGRPEPRFPPSLEPHAAAAIRSHVRAARTEAQGSILGIASGARGGDILFHEICRAEGIPTRVVLPFAPEAFIATSVRGAPRGGWIKRFWRLWNGTAPNRRSVLDLDAGPDPYGACNTAMFETAQACGKRVELLALWDGQGAEKPGGTAAFAAAVQAAGGHVARIDIRLLRIEAKRRTRKMPA
jgi:hypothetical protein